ncbi:hypothetical protein [Priestia filamentosa]|uniref:hypothetical protein n=1 Tax=Priestia filamentosa TaxID=1402861 RepID=UPI00115D24F3|nr:hypothetical protein [Priestia filamentosa]
MGTSHLYEHLLVDYLLNQYPRKLKNVSGFTNRDLIKISIGTHMDDVRVIIDDFIQRDILAFDIQVESYQLQNEIIEQELSIHKNNPQSKIQQILYATGSDNRGLEKPLYSDTFPSIEEVQLLHNKMKTSEITLVVPPSLMKYIMDNYSIVGRNEDIFQSDSTKEIAEYTVYKVQDNVLANPHVSIGIKQGFVDINELKEYSDFYYIRVVTNIFNNRLKSLRNLGVYFNLCFPNYHRGEVSISIMFSCRVGQEGVIFEKISEIISKPLNQDEIFQNQSDEQTDIDSQKQQIKEQIAVLYSNEDMLLKQVADNNIKRVLFIQDLILDNLKKTVIINH